MLVSQKLGHLILVFAGQNAAGGIHQHAARFDHLAVATEDIGLQRHQHRQPLGGIPPLGIRIALEHAQPRAGNIQQNAIGALFETLDGLAGDDEASLDVVGSGATRALFEVVQLPLLHIQRQQTTAPLHQGGQVQGLATGAGTGVDDPHPRLNVEIGGDLLRASILLFEPALLEGLGTEQGGIVEHLEGTVDAGHRTDVDPLVHQSLGQAVGVALQGIDAQVTFGVLRQGAALGRPGVTQLLLAEGIEPLGATIPQGGQITGRGLAALVAFEIEQIGGRAGRQRQVVELMPDAHQTPAGDGGFVLGDTGQQRIQVQAAHDVTGDQGDAGLFTGRQTDFGKLTGVGTIQRGAGAQHIAQYRHHQFGLADG